MTSLDGEAVRVKSENSRLSCRVVDCDPLVPVSVKGRGLEEGFVVRLLTVIVVFWPTKMGFVVNAHVMPAEQAREMAPLKLVGPCAWITKVVWVSPITKGLLALGETSVKAAAPIPVSDTDCGLPVALSVIDKLDARVPLAVGLNVTLTVQLCPTAREPLKGADWQVLVSEKSPVVPAVIFEISNVSVPVLVMDTL
jgi:hypothetical protein